jgi:hypothetical protein
VPDLGADSNRSWASVRVTTEPLALNGNTDGPSPLRGRDLADPMALIPLPRTLILTLRSQDAAQPLFSFPFQPESPAGRVGC